MIRLGLVGKTLIHSFSKSYFEKKFAELSLTDCSYDNFELDDISEITSLVNLKNISGLNVTIPYKEKVIPFLHELSADAKEIGAVNCINIVDGKLIGHNTDVYGFSQSIKPFLDNSHERALILGTGGASKAIAYALSKIGLQVFFVTSKKAKNNDHTFFYSEINEMVMNAFKLIVNTTPLGTYPDVNASPPLPFHLFTNSHFVYDLIYNPAQSHFLKQAKNQGATIMNGLSMLQLQAEKSWEIWNTRH